MIKAKKAEVEAEERERKAAEEPSVKERDRHFEIAKVYKPLEERNYDVRESSVSLKADADMNDVFVPIRCSQEEIETVLFIQSAVPKIK